MTTRVWRILALLVAVAGVPACGSNGDDDEPLSITFATPSGILDAPRQPVIYVRFNRPLDPATVVDQGTVFLIHSSNASIAIGVDYDDCLNEIRIVPDSALVKNNVYQATFTSGITDTDGMAFAGGLFQFTVGASDDPDRPSFTGVTVADNPSPSSIDLTWAAATDPSASGIVYDVFRSTTTGCYDFTAPFLANQGSSTGVTVGGLSASTTYFFVVRARDSFGNVDLNIQERSATTLP
jgi:hypothetical protein